MSEHEELALGKREHPKVLKQFGKYADPNLQSYVSFLGQRPATYSHRTDLTYHFTVLGSTDVNGFALPGGYVCITRGLLACLNSEAELAAVLGHEIGHVTAYHGARGLRRYTGVILLDGPFGVQPTRVAIIYKREHAFILLGAGRDADGLDRAEQAVLASRSLCRLTEPERELATPLVLRVVRGRTGTTYRTLAARSRLSEHPEAQLRLLNGHYPDGEPEPGQRLKTVN